MEVVGCLAGQALEILAQAGIGLGRAQPPEEVVNSDPVASGNPDGGQLGSRATIDGDEQRVSILNAPERPGGVITEIAGRNPIHAYERSTSVATWRYPGPLALVFEGNADPGPETIDLAVLDRHVQLGDLSNP